MVVAAALAPMLACKSSNPKFCNADNEQERCAADEECNLATNECGPPLIDAAPPPPDAPSCQGDSDCVEDGRPICGDNMLCRACENAPDCVAKDPARPLCTNDGACVECEGFADCTDPLAPICGDGTCSACSDESQCVSRDMELDDGLVQCAPSGACVECTEHAHCPGSDVCDRESGACVAEAAVVYVDGTSGADLIGCGTRAQPCESVGIGLLRVEAGRRHVLVAAGDYQEDTIISADTVLVGTGVTLRPSGLDRPAVVVNSGATVTIDGARIGFATGTGAHGLQCRSATASVTLFRATVTGNASSGVDVASGCTMTIVESTIEDNRAFGLRAFESEVDLRRSRVANNDGTGVSVREAPFTIVNNFIVSNGDAGAGGPAVGGVEIDNSSSQSPQRFEFNTVADNQATTDGRASGVNCFTSPALTVRNNIVFAGIGPDALDGNCAWTFSNVEGGVTGAGNINADPMFESAATGNFHIVSGSPVIDIADPTSDEIIDFDGDDRPLGDGYDMGADELE